MSILLQWIWIYNNVKQQWGKYHFRDISIEVQNRCTKSDAAYCPCNLKCPGNHPDNKLYVLNTVWPMSKYLEYEHNVGGRGLKSTLRVGYLATDVMQCKHYCYDILQRYKPHSKDLTLQAMLWRIWIITTVAINCGICIDMEGSCQRGQSAMVNFHFIQYCHVFIRNTNG
jgi:hypothetical protein